MSATYQGNDGFTESRPGDFVESPAFDRNESGAATGHSPSISHTRAVSMTHTRWGMLWEAGYDLATQWPGIMLYGQAMPADSTKHCYQKIVIDVVETPDNGSQEVPYTGVSRVRWTKEWSRFTRALVTDSFEVISGTGYYNDKAPLTEVAGLVAYGTDTYDSAGTTITREHTETLSVNYDFETFRGDLLDGWAMCPELMTVSGTEWDYQFSANDGSAVAVWGHIVPPVSTHTFPAAPYAFGVGHASFVTGGGFTPSSSPNRGSISAVEVEVSYVGDPCRFISTADDEDVETDRDSLLLPPISGVYRLKFYPDLTALAGGTWIAQIVSSAADYTAPTPDWPTPH